MIRIMMTCEEFEGTLERSSSRQSLIHFGLVDQIFLLSLKRFSLNSYKPPNLASYNELHHDEDEETAL